MQILEKLSWSLTKFTNMGFEGLSLVGVFDLLKIDVALIRVRVIDVVIFY
jgi:hypothetical protein